MSTVSSVELQEVVRGLARERFDEYAARGFARAYDDFAGRRRRTIGPVSITADGRPYASFYHVLADPAAKFATGEMTLGPPAPSADEFEFLTPFESIAFHDDGSADLKGPGGSPSHRAIARVLLREHYLVRSRAEDAPDAPGTSRPKVPSLVGTVEQGITICRTLPLVPFEVAILLYLPEERARFEVDLVHSTLLADPRAGRLAAARRLRRTSRLSWGLDRKIGRGHLSLLAARCLEVLVESNGLNAIDLAHVFGGVRELVDSALQALVQQQYATFDPRTGVFRARLEAFLPTTDAPGPRTPAPVRPELLTSVQELIAAADARATCPLCGKAFPPGPHSLLCESCSSTVGLD